MSVGIFGRMAAGLVVAGCVSMAAAQGSGANAEQRLHEEVQAVLVRMIQNGELSAEQAEEMTLQAPAGRQAAFGAYFDVRHRGNGADPGVMVLGVTPGSSAASLGLRTGDHLLAIDGISLVGLGADAQGRALALQPLRERLLHGSEGVALRIARGSEELDLRGPVQVVDLPAYRLDLGAALARASVAAGAGTDGVSSCGRVSVFDIAPRSQHLYQAVLIAVDGKLPGPSDSDTHRLAPGRHVLRVAEAIDARQFGQIQRLQRDRKLSDRYKELEIDVQPGITYRLAARFVLDKRFSIRDGAYWEPVIWKETPETCR